MPLSRPCKFSALLLGVLGLGGCGAEGTSVSVSTSGSCAVRGDTVGLSLLYQQMVSFNQAQPGLMLSVCRIRLPGHADDLPISLTYRPRDQKLYLLGMQGNLYQLNQQTAEGTWVSQLKADPADSTDPYVALPASSAAQIGRVAMAFDPQTDQLRVLGSDGQNLLVNADTGATTTLPTLNRAPNIVKFQVAAAAYHPQTRQLYAVADVASSLVLTAVDPVTGTLTDVGGLDTRAVSGRGIGLGFRADGQGVVTLEVANPDPANPGNTVKAMQLYQFYTQSSPWSAPLVGAFSTNLNDLYALAVRP